MTWDAFSNGKTIEESVPVHALLTKKTPEECRASLEEFCSLMVERGFMVEIPDDLSEETSTSQSESFRSNP